MLMILFMSKTSPNFQARSYAAMTIMSAQTSRRQTTNSQRENLTKKIWVKYVETADKFEKKCKNIDCVLSTKQFFFNLESLYSELIYF